MSYVIAAPEMMTSAASDLAAIGSNVDAAHMVAATRTTSVIPAAADEVSTGIAQLFSQHAANYQALAGQAAAFNDQFVQHLTTSAGAYAATEAANAALLQPLTAIAGSLTSSVAALPGEILNNLLNAANAVLNFIITTPPFDLLGPALAILFSPIWVPLVVAYVLIGFIEAGPNLFSGLAAVLKLNFASA